MAYVLLRPLLDDVPDDELWGLHLAKFCPFQRNGIHYCLSADFHSRDNSRGFRLVALRCIHSVAPVDNQQGWGNVMYIPLRQCARKIGLMHTKSKWRWKRRIAGRLPARGL